MIDKNIIIRPYDKERSVINTSEGRNILVNKASVELINILRNASSKESARENFNRKFNYSFNEIDFDNLIQNKLGQYGILSETQGSDRPLRRFEYLKLRVQFFSPKVVSHLTLPLIFLFKPRIFWPALVFLITLLSSLFLSQSALLSFSSIHVFKVVCLFLLSAIFHELGHAAACASVGIKNGGIGFGFYFIFPVFYADISNIWLATRNRRIIANLAGIFNQLLYAIILILIFRAGASREYFIAAFLIFIKSFTELNPFIRLDGYWILSDLTNTPNLIKKSNHTLKEFFQRLSFTSIKTFSIIKIKQEWRKVLLFIYGIFNWLAFLLYTFYMVSHYFPKILSFPFDLIKFLSDVVILNVHFEDYKGFFLVFAFYVLLLRSVLKYLLRVFQRDLKRWIFFGKLKTPLT